MHALNFSAAPYSNMFSTYSPSCHVQTLPYNALSASDAIWTAAVCVVGVWWTERDGVPEKRAGGGAEAQH